MNKKFKSLIAFSAAVMMLFTACKDSDSEKDNKKDEKNDQVKIEEVLDNVEFNYQGLNDVLSYADNTVESMNDAVSGSLDTSVSTDITISLSDAMKDDIGFDFADVTISNDAKVKGDKIANDLSILYDNKTAVTLNLLSDGGELYFRVPELNEAYVKGDIDKFVDDELANAVDTETTEKITKSFEKFDTEKINDMLNTYMEIIKKNAPEGKDGEKISGSVNDLEYNYDTKDYELTGKIFYNTAMDMLNELKNDKEIAEAYNSIMDVSKSEAESSGYYTEEDIAEMYPSYEDMISEAIKYFEDEKEDAFSSDEVMEYSLMFDGDKCRGFYAEVDGSVIEIAMIDTKEAFGFVFNVGDDVYSKTSMAFSVEGEDGKFNGKFTLNNVNYEYDSDETVTFGFTTDYEITDEKSGAFKGTVEYYVTAEEDELRMVLTSDSDAEKSDVTVEFKYNDESMFTVDMESVTTNATDITIPTGTIYDALDEAQLEEYANSCDLEGFTANLKEVLGEELYSMFMSSTEDDDYYNDEYIDDEYYDEEYYDYYTETVPSENDLASAS